ncbi:ribosome small subunit-dependent GTPase A [Candidatus Palauibacter sp.]|uniref:ribosome small subunit-dependent GTPase A n=1 Tax=Candidatus Palauibacter sp. TaxID=3101350 RepID=UPI003B0196A5
MNPGGASAPSRTEGSAPTFGRVLRIAGGVYHVDDSDSVIQVSLRGRVKRKDSRIVSVGDLVELERVGDEMRIARLRPRHSALARHGVSKRREQVIVANVDQVGVVVSVTAPDPDFLMVDRLLALAALNEIDAFLVVNKTDLAPEGAGAAGPEEADGGDLDQYAALGVETMWTSAESAEGLEALAARLEGRVTVLSGQSGVGKSSLLNALVPGLDLRVGEISERRGRGRHTTVASALYPYPPGGYVADTPGLQYLALWDLDPAELQSGFAEVAEAAEGCRFADCRHRAEPDCAVVEGVERGSISRRRLESYLRLLDEAERA